MASNLNDVKAVKRELSLARGTVVVTVDKDGLTFRRKGDKRRVKSAVVVSWNDVVTNATENQKSRGELVHEGTDYQDFFDFLGF